MKKMIFVVVVALPLILLVTFILSTLLAVFASINGEGQPHIVNSFSFDTQVEEYREETTKEVEQKLKDVGINKTESESFTTIILSMIQVHHDNNVLIIQDPMNIFSHQRHKKNSCTKCLNKCIDSSHSLKLGIKYIFEEFETNNVKNSKDVNKIKTSLENYFNSIEDNVIRLTGRQYANRVIDYFNSYNSSTDSSALIRTALKYVGENGARFQSKYGLSRRDAWCTLFCMYCADEVHLSRSVAPLSTYVPTVMANFKARGQFHYATSGYLPKAGDFIILFGDGHIGIVYRVVGNVVYTIEGNRLHGGLYTCATSMVEVFHDQTITSATGYCTYKRADKNN